MSEELPESWVHASLSALAVVNAKVPVDHLEPATELNFLGMKAVAEETGRIDLSESRLLKKLRKGYTQFVEGDILFAKITPCMENGKVAFVTGLKHRLGYGSTEFHVLRFDENTCHRPFFFHYLVQRSFRAEAQRHMTGSAGQLRVPKHYLSSVRVPLPPLAEQKRIVAKIEELFTKLDDGVESLKKAKAQIKRYRQAVLRDAFTGELTKEWREADVDSLLVEKPCNGRSVRTAVDGFPVLRLTAIRNRHVLLSEAKVGEWTRAEAEPFLVHQNDFLVARGNGSLKLVGKGALVGENPCEVAFPDTMIRLRFDTEQVYLPFLAHLWESSCVRSQIESSARTTAGIYKINQSDIRDIHFRLPNRDEQRQIVSEIERHFSIADAAEEAVDKALKQAERIRQSILKQAFEGKLIPQDPNDEPAEKLLERIKAEKAKREKDAKALARSVAATKSSPRNTPNTRKGGEDPTN